MKISNVGLELIKRYEGKFLTAYHGAADRPGLLTIGYGHTSAAGSPKVTAGMQITEKQAEDILRSDLNSVEIAVNHLVKVPLNQNQFDALVSFTFNLGESNLARSTLLRRINQGDYNVGDEFLKWNKANGVVVKGLVNRRKSEAALWNKRGSVPTEHAAAVITTTVGAFIVSLVSDHEWLPYLVTGTIAAAVVSYLVFKHLKRKKENVELAKEQNQISD